MAIVYNRTLLATIAAAGWFNYRPPELRAALVGAMVGILAFAPMLVLGAQIGLMFGILCQIAFPDLNIQPVGFAVVGMAAFFTGVVRAPLTGIVLVAEMTANVTMLLPMLGACFVAMLVPILLGNPPIYDSLNENARQQRSPSAGTTS